MKDAGMSICCLIHFTLYLLVDKSQELLTLLAYRLQQVRKMIRHRGRDEELLVFHSYDVVAVNMYSH